MNIFFDDNMSFCPFYWENVYEQSLYITYPIHFPLDFPQRCEMTQIGINELKKTRLQNHCMQSVRITEIARDRLHC